MATDVIRVIQYPVNVVRVITAGPQGPAGTGLDTLTTKGDTLGHNGTAAVRVPVGTNGQVLTADSTAAFGVRWTTITTTPAWADITGKPSTFPPEAHNHAASEITSGTFANDRINWAAPSAIGSGTAAAGTFTALIATAELQLPLNAPGTPTAGDLYRVANTLRYRDGSNIERLLLNATDNLANLANPATARTNLGLGAGDSPTFLNLALASGTITASSPFGLTQTWNNGAITFTAFDINITNTASAAASRLLALRTGGVDRLTVDPVGAITASGLTASGGIQSNTGFIINSATGFVNFNNDLIVRRDAANTFAQRNGTTAQTFRLYGTFTDASNGRWFNLTSTTAGRFTLSATGNGTGASGNILALAAPVLVPAASVSLGTNGDLAFEATSNTSLTIRYRGSDGTTRSVALTLS